MGDERSFIRLDKLWGVVWKVALVCALMYPILLVVGVMHGNPYSNFVVGKMVPKHLESLGYDVDVEIEEMTAFTPKVVYDRGHLGTVMSVRFGDESNVEYEYGVDMWTFDVMQYCSRSERLGKGSYDVLGDLEVSKHMESECFDWRSGKVVVR